MTHKQPTPPDPPKQKRRSAKEQALAPLIKRRDAIKKRWDEADAAALRKNDARYRPEHDELDAMIKAIDEVGDEEPGGE